MTKTERAELSTSQITEFPVLVPCPIQKRVATIHQVGLHCWIGILDRTQCLLRLNRRKAYCEENLNHKYSKWYELVPTHLFKRLLTHTFISSKMKSELTSLFFSIIVYSLSTTSLAPVFFFLLIAFFFCVFFLFVF